MSLTSPVKQKEKASIVINTAPLAYCTITETLPSGTISTSKDLDPKTSGDDGMATWTWSINWNTKPSPPPAKLDLSCTKDGDSATTTTYFDIIPS
ncbi:MAG: hypothetical protein A3A33_04295 [Candidatus Yanofskybacteria bacterium RIFCSPLOWO2_01_FULL_49_25]|uniref:Uncharacterized protein n=1 Tax=Candidatus Yanofskybacteria bacterium RIFCSPLOWO2_01_FULL_49_25 TaxID=1802701 RepID=A0A1F8GSI4_9BACT|nr:MAG: hypothetical protein A3A33_04295 [Candidatus Yanofskybacteria bacterium RIFCSPLOWO2_01_FULL_49_25]